MPEITVLGIETVPDAGAELLFEYCHQQISVSVFPTMPSSSYARSRRKTKVEDRLVDLLTRATTTRHHDEYDEIVEDALSIILNAGKTIFDKIRRDSPRIRVTRLRSSAVYQDVLCLRLVTLCGEPSLVPIESNKAHAKSDPHGYEDSEAHSDIDDDYSRYSPPADAWAEEIPLRGGGTDWRIVREDETSLKDYPDLRDPDEEFYGTGLTWEEVGDIMFDSEGESLDITSDRGWEEVLDEELAAKMTGDVFGSNRIVELSEDEYDAFR